MSLQYGFNSHGWDKDNLKWSEKFEALSDVDKDYYHNVLPWTLMVTDVGHVSHETIPVIVFRIAKIIPDYVPESSTSSGKKMSATEFIAFLERFIGFEANVNTTTDREWAKRFLPQDYDKKASMKSDAQVQAERLRFEKEIFGADRKTRYGVQ